MNRFRTLSACCALALLLSACDSTSPESDDTPLNVQTAADVAADPVAATPDGGPPSSTGRYTFYSLAENRVVLPSSETDPAIRQRDSASTKWDLGFRGTTIIVNGGTSGPGAGAAQILEATFASVTEAPASGYATDGSNTCPGVETPVGPVPGAPYAICTGSDNGWYNYGANNLITPIAGRTIVLRTATGHYAKARILSYYRGNPNPPDASAPNRYYTFEYVYQPDGSRDFSAAAQP